MLNKLLDSLFSLARYQKLMVALTVDILLIIIAYLLSLVLSYNELSKVFNVHSWSHFVATVLTTVLGLSLAGFYRSVTRFISFRILLVVAIGATIGGFSSFVYSVLLEHQVFTYSTATIFGCLLCISLGGIRLLVRSYFSTRFNTVKKRVIIYGAGAAGQQLALSLFNGRDFYPVAFVDDDPAIKYSFVQGIRVYSPGELNRLVSYFEAEKVLLALPSISKAQRKKIISRVELSGIPVQTIPGISDIVHGRMKIDEFLDVEIDDLLGRESVPPRQELLEHNIKNKVVMVTGAGGSIGSELCRQIIKLEPRQLLLFEVSEYGLYAIDKELKELSEANSHEVQIKPFLGTIQNKNRLKNILSAFKVDTLYHAAAYKHVPMVEYNVVEGVRNNIFGTLNTAQAAIDAEVETFVLISTDKAVRPTNVMGATKRMAELVLQGLANKESKTRFSMVRFGNVLGSSGSVVPLFKKQIKEGGPVTVTHPDIIRYFMTIPEAAQLVIQAGALGKGGDVFVLDMGEPVKIAELAKKIVLLMGMDIKDNDNQSGDIEIEYTGLRPGEKLYEELLIGNNVEGTSHPRIMTANEVCLKWSEMEKLLTQLDSACRKFEQDNIRNILLNAPTGFNPSDGICDLVWSANKDNNVLSFPESKKQVE